MLFNGHFWIFSLDSSFLNTYRNSSTRKSMKWNKQTLKLYVFNMGFSFKPHGCISEELQLECEKYMHSFRMCTRCIHVIKKAFVFPPKSQATSSKVEFEQRQFWSVEESKIAAWNSWNEFQTTQISLVSPNPILQDLSNTHLPVKQIIWNSFLRKNEKSESVTQKLKKKNLQSPIYTSENPNTRNRSVKIAICLYKSI